MPSDQRGSAPLRHGLLFTRVEQAGVAGGAHLSGLLARHPFKVHTVAAADPDHLIGTTAPLIEHYRTGNLAEATSGQ